jgi:hypothetical protein
MRQFLGIFRLWLSLVIMPLRGVKKANVFEEIHGLG